MESNGYKETEIGMVPTEWDLANLGDLLEPRRESVQPSSRGVARYVGLEHIDSGNPRLTRWGIEADVRSSKAKFTAGDILYGKLRPYLDKVVLAEWEGICATDILVFRAKEMKALPPYLVNVLHTLDFLRHAVSTTTGVNHPRTSWHALRKYEFALPPLPEQRVIAAVLSKIQQAIETQEKIIERTKELKRALMAKIFTEGLNGEELKETEIGMIPKSWQVVEFRTIAEFFQYGTSTRCDYRIHGFPVLRIPNVVGGRVDTSDLKYSAMSEGYADKIALEEGDVLFVRTNGRREYVGRCAVFKNEVANALFASYLIRARLKRNVALPDFVRLYCETDVGRRWLSGRATGAADGKFNINTQILGSTLVPLPSLDQQREIDAAMELIERRLRVLSKKKQSYESLFRSMLNRLMTGRIRVKDMEISVPTNVS